MKSKTDLERLGLLVSLGLTLGDVHRASVYRQSVQFERVQRLKLQTRMRSLLHHEWFDSSMGIRDEVVQTRVYFS